LVGSLPNAEPADAVRRYLERLDLVIERSPLDAADRIMARQEDRQGLGLSRRPAEPQSLSSLASRDEPRAAQALKQSGLVRVAERLKPVARGRLP
jgi:hypothetical protein